MTMPSSDHRCCRTGSCLCGTRRASPSTCLPTLQHKHKNLQHRQSSSTVLLGGITSYHPWYDRTTGGKIFRLIISPKNEKTYHWWYDVSQPKNKSLQANLAQLYSAHLARSDSASPSLTIGSFHTTAIPRE